MWTPFAATVLLLFASATTIDAQSLPQPRRFTGYAGLSTEPLTAILGLEGRYRVSSTLALTATAGHWFLEGTCDNALVGPCSPRDAWTIDVGAVVAFTEPARGWQPYAAARVGPVRYDVEPRTVWTASAGVGLTQTGRVVGLQAELRYHAMFGGRSPPSTATADRLVLYAGVVAAW